MKSACSFHLSDFAGLDPTNVVELFVKVIGKSYDIDVIKIILCD